MRLGYVLVVNLAFGIVSDMEGVRIASAQSSVGFSDPTNMEALLAYRLPDWGYRTSSLQLALSGVGENISGCAYCSDQAAANGYETFGLRWYRESEKRTWSIFGNQSGYWFWNQHDDKPDAAIYSGLSGRASVGGYSRNYVAGDAFTIGSASANGEYQEGRSNVGSSHDVNLTRMFRGNLSVGLGLGRMRDVTPVFQAQRISERLRALGRETLPQEGVLSLATVLAQRGGYYQVFDRPDRQLWRDVLNPLIARGETLTPFELYYLGDVFYEALGSRQEGLIAEVNARFERETGDNPTFRYGTSSWGPNIGLQWSHNLNLDHQLAANLDVSYVWSDLDAGVQGETGFTDLSLVYLWVLADRFSWVNRIGGGFTYDESTGNGTRIVTRKQAANLLSSFNVYVEDHVSVGPSVDVRWQRQEFDQAWTEYLDWRVGFNLTYDLTNALF